jgi:hypothetical protein
MTIKIDKNTKRIVIDVEQGTVNIESEPKPIEVKGVVNAYKKREDLILSVAGIYKMIGCGYKEVDNILLHTLGYKITKEQFDEL